MSRGLSRIGTDLFIRGNMEKPAEFSRLVIGFIESNRF